MNVENNHEGGKFSQARKDQVIRRNKIIKQTAIAGVCLVCLVAVMVGVGFLIQKLLSRSPDTKSTEESMAVATQPAKEKHRSGVAMVTASVAAIEPSSLLRFKFSEPKEEDEVLSEEEIRKKAEEFLNNMTLEEKVAQMFIITPDALTGHDSVNRAGDVTKEALKEYPVGGLVYFSKNLVDEEQLKKMTSQVQEYAMEISGLPLLLSVDEEGGTVARIANHWGFQVEQVGDMSEIGKSQSLKKAYEAGDTIGSYLKDYGLNMDFAPVADILSDPDNELLKKRSFGSSSKLVSDMAMQVAKGLNHNGIYAVVKHFPGHGAVSGDTHDGLVYTDRSLDQLKKNEFIPFQNAIDQGIDFIMVGHICVPEVIGTNTPSSLSRTMITDILRGELVYEGIVITDALDMGAIKKNYSSGQAAVMAVQAGVDILLMPEDFKTAYQAVMDAVKDGIISEERIDESVLRIVIRKMSLGESWKNNGIQDDETQDNNESSNHGQGRNEAESQTTNEHQSNNETGNNAESANNHESQASDVSQPGEAPQAGEASQPVEAQTGNPSQTEGEAQSGGPSQTEGEAQSGGPSQPGGEAQPGGPS